MSVKLVQVGEFATREFPIEVEVYNIGRDYTCELRLDHGRISRNHCRILKRGRRVLVEALYSSAGTAVNDHVLDPSAAPYEVYDGDHLWVGPEHFQFVIMVDDDEPRRPAEIRKGAWTARQGAVDVPDNPLLKDVPASQSRVASKLLERMNEPEAAPEPPESVAVAEPPVAPEPVGSVDVTHREGVALVRLLHKSIIAEHEIRTITEELDELIDSGKSNITLHLGNVERMSSQVIGEVFQIYKRCKAKGGMLKICKVSPQVAGVFALTNMQRHIEIFPDETMALKSLWPQNAAPAASPKPAEKPRTGDRPTPPPATTGASPSSATIPTFSFTPAPAAQPKQVQLIVEVGKAKGRIIELRAPRFLIGRDQQCQLRPNSPGISRLHTAIEQRDGRVFVRDMGSQIGTILNDRVLRNQEAEAFHGDRLQVEVLQFTFGINAAPADPAETPASKDGSLSGLFGAHAIDASADTSIMTLPEFAAAPAYNASPAHPPGPQAPAGEAADSRSKRPRLMTFQDVDDVIVITLRTPDLDEESVISAVRVELENILAQPGRDRIVIRFDHVKTLSRGAVVMFLARAQHMVRTQGTMRFCNVAPPVMEFLEKTQLPLLIEIYSTLEESLSTPWIDGN
jgi:anti-anti-sigma factor